MDPIRELLDRIDESINPVEESVNPGTPRDSTTRQTPVDPLPMERRTAAQTPFVSHSVATMTGLPHQTVVEFMEMLENGTPWVTAAEKLSLSTGQAMDIKSSMVDVGAYKEPGELAEGLRLAADHFYRLADRVEEDHDAVFEAQGVLRRFHQSVLNEGVTRVVNSTAADDTDVDVYDKDLPDDARIIARAYADAIQNQLTLPPDDPEVKWNPVFGSHYEARVQGSVGDKDIVVHVDINPRNEAPYMRFAVPEQDSTVVMKLTRHNWMGPLSLTMQHVTRALLQSPFHYSELESHRRIDPEGMGESVTEGLEADLREFNLLSSDAQSALINLDARGKMKLDNLPHKVQTKLEKLGWIRHVDGDVYKITEKGRKIAMEVLG